MDYKQQQWSAAQTCMYGHSADKFTTINLTTGNIILGIQHTQVLARTTPTELILSGHLELVKQP